MRLPHIFANGMVLQRDKPAPVWGWAEPKATISVVFRGHTSHATAGADGTWKTTLPAAHAGGPFDLTIRSANGRIDLHDVLVGDVWVASGQSNMEFTRRAGIRGVARDCQRATIQRFVNSRSRRRGPTRRKMTSPAARGPLPIRSTSALSAGSDTSSRATCAARSTFRSASSTPRGAGATSRRGSTGALSISVTAPGRRSFARKTSA